MSHGAPFNFPEYDDGPKRIDGVRDTARGKHAECSPWTHPIGGGTGFEAAGEFVRSGARRDELALIDFAMEWKAQFVEKEWTA